MREWGPALTEAGKYFRNRDKNLYVWEKKVSRARKNMKGNDRPSGPELMRILLSQEKRCCYSGVELTVDNCSLDHKKPVSKGGTNHPKNLQWTTKEINKMKGSLTEERFIEICKEISKHRV